MVVPMVYEGSLVGFLGFDSTDEEKKWSEADVRLLKMVAEIFVGALERKRAERRAVRAERMAAMGRMAAGVAHEINNPLQAIQSNLELALDFDLEPGEREECLEIARQEIERLGEVSRRMLSFARPSGGTRCPTSIVTLTEHALTLVGEQLRDARIEVTKDFADDLPRLMVAPDSIMQVLVNVVVNAIEALGDGGHLHVQARVDGDAVELTLANNGPAIPPENIERVFDPFFTTKPESTGLGLAVSHQVMQWHGGQISVENLEGDRGVAFVIRLPIVGSVQERGRAA
jgi:signal transduction histidine kinase